MAHERLKALTCYREMHDRILVQPVSEVARWLQEEKGEFAGTKRDSLVRALARYKTDVPPAELNLRDGAATQARLEEIEGDLDELETLGELVRLQMRRIRRAESVEQTIGINSKLSPDLEVAGKLLVQSAELKFKLGIYKESERSMTVNHNFTTSKAIESLSPEERRRAGVIAQQLLTTLALPQSTDSAADAVQEAEEAVFELVSVTAAPPNVTNDS